ncbi:MAG: transcription-repair coupling factor [Armatimonadota bacterium]|nr:transcription-repair coupling factor [Armatimonadota bacterium]MDW8156349.1 transcription-repair coupling factor [Armatimonadota bacterium]
MSLEGLLHLTHGWPRLRALREELVRLPARAWALVPADGGKALLLADLLAGEPERPALVLVPGRESAECLLEDLVVLAPALRDRVRFLPPLEALPHDPLPPAPEVVGERLRALAELAGGRAVVAVAPAAAACRPVPAASALRTVRKVVRVGEETPMGDVLQFLQAGGYERVDLVQTRGTYAVRGGIVDVFPPDADLPWRLEWFGDVVDSIRRFDPETQRSQAHEQSAELPLAHEPEGDALLLDLLPPDALVVLDEPAELEAQVRSVYRAARQAESQPHNGPHYLPWDALLSAAAQRRLLAASAHHRAPDGWRAYEVPVQPVEAFAGQTALLADEVAKWLRSGQRVVVASAQAQRIREILLDHGVPVDPCSRLEAAPAPGLAVSVTAPLSRGFRVPELQLVVVTDAEILGWKRRRRRLRIAKEGAALRSWSELSPEDLVVHLHHGIGRYRGVVRKAVGGAERDYLHLEYAEGDALFVPTDQIHLVQRYVGVEGHPPRIHRLGTADWEREKRRVREATQQVARELLELYARREAARGHAFSPDTPWQRELEASFEFEETPDQWKAIEDVKRDMESPRPMDRLVAGDVGYGKTEVAVRAAFKAVMDGKQVAVLVPTTLLAQQHWQVFRSRFAAFPVRVEMVSRFRSPREVRRVLEDLATGAVDVVIGTHRLLQKDVRFKDLGLVIIDEEQRFGVMHKERLKQLRASVDVLTLTATPIPRTLHMSLVGLRDMSLMETPPDARLPIRTTVAEWSESLVQEAIRRELARGGQVYVVHNRVQTIERAARRVQALVPEARVAVAHGQMPESQLERVMLDFVAGRYDVLVCTTIVEIGLDIPRVNTILVEDAHTLGLAQLYQLRGRVGRADQQAYAYLLYPKGAQLGEEAKARLQALREFVALGSGIRLAMRDLEIRGAGNLLGPEQHGHMAAVGFDLYTRLLEEAVRRLRGEFVEEAPDPVVELRVSAFVPESYVPQERERLAVYRKLATARGLREVAEVEEELVDRYGPLPEPVRNLIQVAALREMARALGVSAVVREDRGVLLRVRGPLPRDEVRWLALEYRGRVEVAPEGVLVRAPEADDRAFHLVRDVLDTWLALRHRRPQPVTA